MSDLIRILSFDPSLRNWGYVAADYDNATGLVTIVSTGTLKVKSDEVKANVQLMDEAALLFRSLRSLYTLYRPSLVITELPHGSQSFSATKSYALVITILGILNVLSVPIKTVSVYDAKLTVGTKTATKEEVVSWVVNKHPNVFPLTKAGTVSTNKYQHEADAILVMYTHLYSIGVKP